ncbi:MAG TPA: carboxypeptidase regulatory-like domain-containing protein [Kofleriaceae bacterium]|nr:carboxypeptidase regulatory-like domain-containing protein [Kofleriaceae bacterium]
MPGDSRLVRQIGIVTFFLAVLGGVWWWSHRRASNQPATSTVTQPQRGATATAGTPERTAEAPASLAITVSDERGPLADAAVRLAPRAGEVIVVRTGADGVARAERLEPGAWTVSASAADHVPAALPTRQLAAGADERLAIRLARGGRALTGTVSDATGGPIAGARIDAARLSASAEPSDAVSSTLTGPDGKYRLTVAEGQLLVAAASADYAPQSKHVEVGAAGAVADFALVPGGVIEGVVRDERTREPVPGAAVVARRDSPAMLLAETGARLAVAGGDGRFRLGGLRPGAWDLRASDHGRGSKAQTLVGIGVAEQVADVELLIGSVPVIRGQVVDEAGAPAPGVEVRAFARGEDTESRADEKGAFVLEGLRPGEYFISASHVPYLPDGGARVSLADKDVDGVTVKVKRAYTLKGHVEPRQVCDIQQEPGERDGGPLMMLAGTTTGPDGEFTLATGDGAIKLTARCASGDQGDAQVTASRSTPDTVVPVTPGGSIAGRVVDGAGKPVVGVVVMASKVSGTERMVVRNGMITSGVQALTDAAGAYKIEGLSGGSYRMGVVDRGRPLPQRTQSMVDLGARERKTGVELAVDRPDGVIRGVVTGPDGKPLPDAWVSVSADLAAMLEPVRGGDHGSGNARMMVIEDRDSGAPESSFPPALTDAQGHFEIGGLPRATYAVVAEAQRGQLRARNGGVVPDATIELRALGVTSLSGTVAGASGPSTLFSVELDGPTRTTRSFTDGAFTFARVDPGSYTVRVQSRDGNGQATVEVVPNEPATVDIKLASNAIVVGQLVDGSGHPVAGQAVALVPDSGDGRLQIALEGPPPTTGPDGRFRLEHRPGKSVLIVLRQPRPFTRRGLVLEAGKTLDLGAIALDDAPPPGPSQRARDRARSADPERPANLASLHDPARR